MKLIQFLKDIFCDENNDSHVGHRKPPKNIRFYTGVGDELVVLSIYQHGRDVCVDLEAK